MLNLKIAFHDTSDIPKGSYLLSEINNLTESQNASPPSCLILSELSMSNLLRPFSEIRKELAEFSLPAKEIKIEIYKEENLGEEQIVYSELIRKGWSKIVWQTRRMLSLTNTQSKEIMNLLLFSILTNKFPCSYHREDYKEYDWENQGIDFELAIDHSKYIIFKFKQTSFKIVFNDEKHNFIEII